MKLERWDPDENVWIDCGEGPGESIPPGTIIRLTAITYTTIEVGDGLAIAREGKTIGIHTEWPEAN